MAFEDSINHLSTFSLFPKLPYDVRALIWGQALRRGRLIKVTLHDYQDRVVLDKIYDIEKLMSFPEFRTVEDRLPPLLRTCREARRLALRVYEVCLSSDLKPVYGPSLQVMQGKDYQQQHPPVKSSSRSSDASSTDQAPTPWAETMLHSAGYTSKGIIFHPACDMICFLDKSDGPSFHDSMYNLNTALFKTTNIQFLALEQALFRYSSPAFKYLFVPYTFVPKGQRDFVVDNPLGGLKELVVFDRRTRGHSPSDTDARRYHKTRKLLQRDGRGSNPELILVESLWFIEQWTRWQ